MNRFACKEFNICLQAVHNKKVMPRFMVYRLTELGISLDGSATPTEVYARITALDKCHSRGSRDKYFAPFGGILDLTVASAALSFQQDGHRPLLHGTLIHCQGQFYIASLYDKYVILRFNA